MCRVLRVARVGFYPWLHKPVSAREQENSRLLKITRDAYAARRGVFGVLGVFGDLKEAGETCGKHRVARLILAHRIKALRGYRARTRPQTNLTHRAQPSQPQIQRRGP